MASVSRRFVLLSRRCSPQTPCTRFAPKQTPQWQRPLSTTPSRRADKPPTGKGKSKPAAPAAKAAPATPAAPTPTASEIKDAQTEPKKPKKAAATPETIAANELQKIVEDLKAIDPEIVEDAIRKGKQGVSFEKRLMNEEAWDIPREDTRKIGFWGEGEEWLGKDEDYYGDDLTTLGHAQLEQHRELREYARLIAWELPLLNQLARPFEPPTEATPFRFRYTSYVGEQHPAANKVVVEFCASDMKLNEMQTAKLIKLAGVRYNPDTDVIKMSCEDFDTQTQNKRFLGETITKLLKEAKDMKDTFADVPFDFRHHKPKVRYQFPEQWIMTPERKKYLEDKRAQTLKLDDEKLNNGELIDGKTNIDSTLLAKAAEERPEPVLVGAGAPRGKRA